MPDLFDIQTLLILVLGGIFGWIIGYVIERYLFRYLAHFPQLVAWHLDEILFDAWRGVVIWVSLVIGVYISTHYVDSDLQSNEVFINTIVFILIILFTWGTARMLAGFLSYWFKRAKGATQTTSMISATTYILVFTIGLLVALQTIGVAISPIIAALGVGGLAVALAIRPVLEDIFAGLQLLLSNTIKPGDYVEVEGDHRGKVVDISWRTTTLVSLGTNEKIIPNSKLVKATVINFNRPSKVYPVKAIIELPHDSDLEKLEAFLLAEAKELIQQNECALRDVEPRVRFKSIDDSVVKAEITIKINQFTDHAPFEHQLLKQFCKHLKKKKIKIVFE